MSDDPLPYRSVLGTAAAAIFDLHREAAARKDWLASGVWGAVFLEAFLEAAMRARGISLQDRVDLGGAINRLRNDKELPNRREVLDRCESVRLARNALVHASAAAGRSTDAYANTIGACLREVVELAEPWFAGVEPPAASALPEPPPAIARVFVSTITPHLPRQAAFLRDLAFALRQRGLQPVSLVMDEYDRKDPMAKVLDALRGCDALLCVGLERSHAFLLRQKEGSDGQSEATHGYFSSGWLNMEAGAAFALGLPVLVMCEEHISLEGIFDRDWNSAPPFVLAANPLTVEDPPPLGGRNHNLEAP